MSLRAPLAYALPDETVRIARAAFLKGNPYMRMRDVLGPIYTNPDFAPLFPRRGQPAEAPAHLALVTIMQFAEGLSDAQAADAVRGRIDWKYALALELTDPGFDASVLSEFRDRLLAGNAEAQLFDAMLLLFRQQGLLKAKGRQRTDSTHILGAIQVLNRLECVGETLRAALNTLATVAPEWLQAWAPSPWFDRYSRRFQDYRLPSEKTERYALAEQIGADGLEVLRRVYEPLTPIALRELPAVQVLRQVWLQQFHAAAPDQPLRWRTAEDLPPAPLLISTPYDPDARYSKKRDTEWTGYKVHLTETCDDDTPHLITDVTTTIATTPDAPTLPTIQANLTKRELVPCEQIVDSGYMAAEHLVSSQNQHGIDLLGPVGDDQSWQARAGAGFAIAQFTIDWDAKQAICPQGKSSVQWLVRQDQTYNGMIQIGFAASDCAACALRAACTQSAKQPRRLTVHAREHYEALQQARQRQQSEAFKSAYASRAGIEGTISQGTRGQDLRRSRYRGFPKTRLMHFVLAAALNFMRVAAWLAETPRTHTRRSAFAALAPGTG
jgi:transposase